MVEYKLQLPEYKYEVKIPKGGQFSIFYTIKLSKWQIFWMRFIGWEVIKLY